MIRQIALSCTLSLLPVFAMAQTVGPSSGEREITLSGSGGSDKDFDSGNFSISGDIGWYTSNSMLLGIRQSVQYQDIQGVNIDDDAWNGSTRGFIDWHFGSSNWRPFVGASLDGVYGDNIADPLSLILITLLAILYLRGMSFLRRKESISRSRHLLFFQAGGSCLQLFY
jgi:hypothetical protein